MRKENIRYWITYLLLIIFFILGAVFYRQPFIVLIILLLAILPVFSIAILLFFYHNLEIKVSRVTPSVSIGHDIELVLSVINTSPFSFLNSFIPLATCSMKEVSHRLYLYLPMQRRPQHLYRHTVLQAVA